MKQLTRQQVQARKDKAVRFTDNVLQDPDRAAEIENESLESYASRRGFQLSNPTRGGRCGMPTKDELMDRIAELEQENEDLQSQLDDIADIVAPSEEEGGDGNGYDGSDDDND